MKIMGRIAFLVLLFASLPLHADNFGGEYHELGTPCRVVDTRIAGTGGPLVSGVVRTFALFGPPGAATPSCGVPTGIGFAAGARAVTGTVTVVAPTQDGFITLFPAYGSTVPPNSNINFTAGVPALATGFTSAVCPFCPPNTGSNLQTALKAVLGMAGPGTAHLIIDITGYFTPTSSLRAWVTAADPGTGAVTLHITDPQEAAGVAFDVDWGDGTTSTPTPDGTGDVRTDHTYTNHATGQFYSLSITSHYISSIFTNNPALLTTDRALQSVQFK